MGTDIYLLWKGISSADQDPQNAGFSIQHGSAGYLRASIGMQQENYVLRALFDECYWNTDTTKPYDFKGNYVRMASLALPYLLACVTGEEIDGPTSREVFAQTIGGQLAKALAQAGEGHVVMPGSKSGDADQDLRYGIMWFESLIEFFELGMEKQQSGLSPYPVISW